MNLLLDTHTLIWVFDANEGLSERARAVIADGSNTVFVSAASAWEITIKEALGKLRLHGDYLEGVRRYRFTPLEIRTEHALALRDLPLHHRDPFDRILIAQARYEELTLVTRDERFDAYDVPLIRA